MPPSKIRWTQDVWNPTTGCSKLSEGCKNCYAERMANRLFHMGKHKYRNNFQLTIHDSPRYLHLPLRKKRPTIYFVDSMSDLFHKNVPLAFIRKVFTVMNQATQHLFLLLTKRPERLQELSRQVTFTANIWLGVTVELPKYYFRIDLLRNTPAHVNSFP